MNDFINFILKQTEGGAAVESIAENHDFTLWSHLLIQNKFGIKKIKLVTIDKQGGPLLL